MREREERLRENEENLIREREAIMAQLELSSVARSESVTSLSLNDKLRHDEFNNVDYADNHRVLSA